MTTETDLDLKGLICPLPVLRARKALQGARVGTIFRITATDPNAVGDFRAYCKTTGHGLLECRESDGVFIFRIEKLG